jgi:hypothetical protein
VQDRQVNVDYNRRNSKREQGKKEGESAKGKLRITNFDFPESSLFHFLVFMWVITVMVAMIVVCEDGKRTHARKDHMKESIDSTATLTTKHELQPQKVGGG